MHLSLFVILILLIPFQIIVSTSLEWFNLESIIWNFTGPGVSLDFICFAIPIVIGNFTYHRSYNKYLTYDNLTINPVKTSSHSTRKKKFNFGLLILIIAIVTITGYIVEYCTPTPTVDHDPVAIQQLGNKYKEFLKTETKTKTEAQQSLITWLNEQPSVFSASTLSSSNESGIKINYCSSNGIKSSMESSWDDVERQ